MLRYLLNDHAEMSPEAKRVINNGAYTTVEVLSEVVYVLNGVYKANRQEIYEWLCCLLDDVLIENKKSILCALRVYGETSLDFVDCILIGYNRILGRSIFSFDKKLNSLLSDG